MPVGSGIRPLDNHIGRILRHAFVRKRRCQQS